MMKLMKDLVRKRKSWELIRPIRRKQKLQWLFPRGRHKKLKRQPKLKKKDLKL